MLTRIIPTPIDLYLNDTMNATPLAAAFLLAYGAIAGFLIAGVLAMYRALN